MPHRTPWLVVALAAIAGCEDDSTLTVAPDAGPAPDSGDSAGPLPLAAGMEFTYRAILTRARTQDAETSATYRIRLRITEVEDEGTSGPSRLSFSMTDLRDSTNPDWSLQNDFSSWVGRLGPSRDADVVDDAPVEMVLDGAPELPPAPESTRDPAKVLPVASTFFVDIRNEAALGTAWEAANAGRDTAVSLRDDGAIGATLVAEGPDDGVQFHDEQRRRIELEYTVSGFLQGLSETVGPPRGQALDGTSARTTGELFLEEGP